MVLDRRNGRSITGLALSVAILVVLCVSPASAQDDATAAGAACGRLASVQNDVQTRAAAGQSWVASSRNQELFALDRLRTGEASRAAILYSDQTLHRINEKSEIEIVAPDAGSPGVLKVISGKHYFSSRRPKDYGRVETPTVTAAIRGTEFVVDVEPGGTTTITMIEGVVDASNEFGDVQVSAGEAAFVEPGKAPVKRLVVRPRDAVSWSLYYPRVLGSADGERIRSTGAKGQQLARAAEMLAAGQVDQASREIREVRESDADNPLVLALASVIEIVSDRKEKAMTLARRAYESDADSSAAALAMSFAHQSAFEIVKARKMAEAAVRLAPDSAEALARLAELRMAEGDTYGARDAAEKAVRRDGNSARALAVLGFVRLAELKSIEALDYFEQAVGVDPAFPLARLGLGLAMMRQNLVAGREELQTAVILDPENSLFRSYLSKAYFEGRSRH
jgi:Tfp pilus assembly protein PilF